MKNKRWHSYIWMILCMAILLLVMPAGGTAQAQEVGGNWKLISVEVKEKLPVDQAPSREIAENKYAWVLVEIVDYENADRWATADAHLAYAVTHVYSRGVYSASNTYEGVDTYGQGLSGTLGLQAVYTGVPEIIYPDEPVSLNFSFTVTENTVVKLSFGGSAGADFDQWDLGAGGVTRDAKHFANKDGIYSFILSTASDSPLSYNETLTAKLGPGVEGDRIALRTTASMFGVPMGTNYVYEWKQVEESAVEPLTIIPGNSNPGSESGSSNTATNSTAGQLIARVIVVVGIAIAGTLSTIAGELANKAAQAAASENDEQPTQEIVYVLNPSHKLFNLDVNKPVTLTVNGYRVTQEGHQIEKGALISISLPPDMAEYFSLKTTGSNGQVSCIITLLKMPSATSTTLDVNGVFPKGKEKTQVKLAFKTEFSISPVRTPKITYYEKDKQWRAPELIAAFRDPVQNTPIKVGFNYVFDDPPLTFKPDILEVKESYSSDEGLTYNFRLKVKDDINLETFFGEDLTEDDGRVMVDVVVKDESGKEYAAKTELQLHPQLKMIAYAYDLDIGKSGRPETPYNGLELKDMQFVADGIDVLPLVFFFVRTDKELLESDEYLSAVDLVDVLSVKFTAGKFPDPEVNAEDSGEGLFAYSVRSSDFIPYTREEEKKYFLEVEPVMRAGAPNNIGLSEMTHLIPVSPQFMKFHLWVVPGQYRGQSEAFAYVQLYPSKTGVPNMPLTLEVENPPDRDRGFLELINSDREQNTRETDIRTIGKYIPLPKGSACWTLKYSGMNWKNLSSCVFKVTCYGPKTDTGAIQASQIINVGDNISNLLSDLVDQSGQLELNNPYWKDSIIPVHMRGPIWNVACKGSTTEPYVCKVSRNNIMNWLTERSLFGASYDPKRIDGPKHIESMMNMNGIEFQFCSFTPFHVWANLFLSGTHEINDAKALDPWWEQHWTDPAMKNHENLITVYSELSWKLSERGLGLRAVAEVSASVLVFAGVVAAISTVAPFLVPLTIPSAVAVITTTYIAASPAALIALYGGTVDVDNYHADGIKKRFGPNWFMGFIEKLSNSSD